VSGGNRFRYAPYCSYESSFWEMLYQRDQFWDSFGTTLGKQWGTDGTVRGEE